MTAADDSSLLNPDERPAAQVLNAQGTASAVLVCEHASRFIPAALNGLGLDDAAAISHAAWDIGAFDLARNLAQLLDAPLVASRVSRLVYDCNRPPEADGAIPAQSEIFAIPGNTGLSDDQRAARVRDVYEPFQTLLRQVLDAQNGRPLVITIHSFTPVYCGHERDVQIGILHDSDTRLADAMLAIADRHTSLIVRRNDPYGPQDGVTHSLREHALPRHLPNVMIEIRNDLLGDPEACRRMAVVLADWLQDAIVLMDHKGEQRA